ncbi:hypothetical protein SFK227_2221 [Shigella flexneri K-227]|uniref:Uncharacterized protein n=1 Tax=Shigella flexneri K-227 TaxID=766147 RepID=F5NVR5_SHIFL|nr:hypothetical protein SFK227_2221 [Shigella flexneri K-227]
MVSRFQGAGQRSINVIFGLFCCAGITCGCRHILRRLLCVSGCGPGALLRLRHHFLKAFDDIRFQVALIRSNQKVIQRAGL